MGVHEGPGGSWTLWRYGVVTLESLGMFFVDKYAKNIVVTADFWVHLGVHEGPGGSPEPW